MRSEMKGLTQALGIAGCRGPGSLRATSRPRPHKDPWNRRRCQQRERLQRCPLGWSASWPTDELRPWTSHSLQANEHFAPGAPPSRHGQTRRTAPPGQHLHDVPPVSASTDWLTPTACWTLKSGDVERTPHCGPT